jgi:hypothetical protein
MKENHPARNQEKGKKKRGLKSNQNIAPKSAKPTMGSPKRRNYIT